MSSDLSGAIEMAWEAREGLSLSTIGAHRDAVESTLAGLDSGTLRAAEKIDGTWKANAWVKKAILLSFRLNDMKLIEGAPGDPARPHQLRGPAAPG